MAELSSQVGDLLMATIRENCVCGAVVDYSGQYPGSVIDDFRRDHARCREAWKNSLHLLELIAAHNAEHGYALTVREVGAQMGWSSPATVMSHLHVLRRLGLVDWVDGQTRTLHLTVLGRQALERRKAAA